MRTPGQLPVLRLGAALIVCATLGCATNPDPAKPGATPSPRGSTAGPAAPPSDEPRTGEISFPRPERETCTPKSRAPYRLSVRVRDDMGGAFPNVTVNLLPMGAGSEKLSTAKTNQNGIANAVANPPGVYAVTVTAGGFEPQVRPLTMRAGCTGFTTFTLKPGPVAK
jgi:hypothetical protein